jgi:cytochrome d ubiquinol oxidase subunit II
MLIPVLGFVGGILGILFARLRHPVAAFWSSAVSQFGIIGTAGVSMFPFIMPSSSDPRSSLTVWDSVSSHLTLEVMFWSAVIFTPIVISYTAWCYKMMSGKVTTEYVEANDHSAY